MLWRAAECTIDLLDVVQREATRCIELCRRLCPAGANSARRHTDSRATCGERGSDDRSAHGVNSLICHFEPGFCAGEESLRTTRRFRHDKVETASSLYNLPTTIPICRCKIGSQVHAQGHRAFDGERQFRPRWTVWGCRGMWR